MYENITYEFLLSRMLNRAQQEYPNADTREGSVLHICEAPAAVELQNIYIELDRFLTETFADTASREYLIRRCHERGISPQQATYAQFKGEFNPEAEVLVGSRFGLDQYTYIVTEYIADGEYKLVCENQGSQPNNTFGTLIPLTVVNNLNYAELTECLVQGEDEESTEHLRKRYFDSVQSISFGGNINDYKTKTNAIDGVGATKVFPVWNGGGTVKLVILNSDYGVPSSSIVDDVQEKIDPIGEQGEGLGLAPIGHTVTVVAAGTTEIDVETDITYATGYTWEAVEAAVKAAIDNYLLSLCKVWEDEASIVRVVYIEQAILSVEGVVDVANTTLNGGTSNVPIDSDKIPVRGEVVGNS